MPNRTAHRAECHAAKRRFPNPHAYCLLLTFLLSGCTVPYSRPELIVDDAGAEMDGAVVGADAARTSGNSGSNAAMMVGSAGMSTAGTGTTAAAGSGGMDAGFAQGGAGGSSLFPLIPPDAGVTPDDAGADQAAEQATCLLNFAGCALFDPLFVAECATKAGPNCPELLGVDAGNVASH